MYGTAAIHPAGAVRVARCYQWTIVYTIGEAGLSQKGRLVLTTPKAGFSSPKLFPPDEPHVRVDNSLTGFVTAQVSRADAAVILSLDNPPHAGNYGLGVQGGEGFIWPGSTVLLRVTGGDLRKGDVITITYGDRISGSAGAASGTYAHRAEFAVFVDPDGALSGSCAGYCQVEGELEIEVLNDPARRLIVAAPSVVRQGEKATVRVVPRDEFDNLDIFYDVGMQLTDSIARQMPYATVTRKKGVAAFAGVDFSPRTGPVSVEVENDRGLTGRSNPIVVTANPSAPLIFWGDVHVHTELCDGLGTVEEAYEYARDAACIDFAAIATHDTLCDKRDWAEMQDAAERLHEPGRFIPFLAYEYGERKVGGDKTVLYKNSNEEIFRSVDEGSKTPDGLWEKLRGRQAITMPHSGAHRSMGTNWAHHEPDLQRLVEIYSEWGNSEYPGNPRPVTWDHQLERRPARPGGTVQEGLATGARVGVMAASDNHSGQPGYSNLMGSFARRRAYRGGLTAVYAGELTRDALWDGLWNRRCYGTTGARIILYFVLNGQPMGSDIPFRSLEGNTRKIEVSVAGSDAIRRVDVIRNNQEVFTHSGDQAVQRVEFEDADPIGPLFLTGVHSPGPFLFYYIRVTQVDGEMAWSSPIWISK
ncbi:MAG: DUF3604 domain-containing protein [Planctomycetota bacterium]